VKDKMYQLGLSVVTHEESLGCLAEMCEYNAFPSEIINDYHGLHRCWLICLLVCVKMLHS